MSQNDADDSPDRLRGKRIHCWVLVAPSDANDESATVAGPYFFVEPSTGELTDVSDGNYTGIEAIWNDKNYWVNLQTSDAVRTRRRSPYNGRPILYFTDCNFLYAYVAAVQFRADQHGVLGTFFTGRTAAGFTRCDIGHEARRQCHVQTSGHAGLLGESSGRAQKQ